MLPVCAGVFAFGREVTSLEGEWMAAVLAGGPSTFLCRRSAAALWGIARPRGSLVEVVRRDSRSPRAFRMGPPGLSRYLTVRVRRSELLTGDEVGFHRRIPITSLNRTLMELAASEGEDRCRPAFNEADRLNLLNVEELRFFVRANPRRAGIAALRRLADALHPEVASTRSELEAMFLESCRQGGLPAPQVNRVVEGFEVDCVWPDERLVVELDGYEFHRGRMAFDRDARRDFVLKKAGYRVTRVTYSMVKDDAASLTEFVRRELAN